MRLTAPEGGCKRGGAPHVGERGRGTVYAPAGKDVDHGRPRDAWRRGASHYAIALPRGAGLQLHRALLTQVLTPRTGGRTRRRELCGDGGPYRRCSRLISCLLYCWFIWLVVPGCRAARIMAALLCRLIS